MERPLFTTHTLQVQLSPLELTDRSVRDLTADPFAPHALAPPLLLPHQPLSPRFIEQIEHGLSEQISLSADRKVLVASHRVRRWTELRVSPPPTPPVTGAPFLGAISSEALPRVLLSPPAGCSFPWISLLRPRREVVQA